MPTVTVLSSAFRAAGTYEFPATSLPQSVRTVRLDMDCTNFSSLGSQISYSIEVSWDNSTWKYFCGAIRPGGSLTGDGGGAASQATLIINVEPQQNGISRRVRGRVTLQTGFTFDARVTF